MANPVIIKGNRYGIVLLLDKDMPFPRLCDKIRMKFQESNKFFDSSVQMAISFDGRTLTNEEQDHIIEIINQCCDLNISYVIDKDDATERLFEEKIREASSPEKVAQVTVTEPEVEQEPVSPELAQEAEEEHSDSGLESATVSDAVRVGSVDNVTSNLKEDNFGEDMGHFYRGTLRSGQSIEFASSIVIIGDVNPGAKVVAKGNIIVIGSLKGSAYAGVNGKPNSFIIALDMDPMQLRIGDLYARSPDSKKILGMNMKKRKQVVKEMQIAFVENNNIYIEPINRSVLSSII